MSLTPIGQFTAAQAAAVHTVITDIDDTITTEGALTATAYAALERQGLASARVGDGTFVRNRDTSAEDAATTNAAAAAPAVEAEKPVAKVIVILPEQVDELTAKLEGMRR